MAGYVLDSFAILAFLQKERGGERVNDLLEKAQRKQATVLLSEISLGEVYYILIRALGLEEANVILAHILALPITIASVSRDDVLAAAQYKARGAISYADCFVVALARVTHATIVTGDRGFKAFEKDANITWIDAP